MSIFILARFKQEKVI